MGILRVVLFVFGPIINHLNFSLVSPTLVPITLMGSLSCGLPSWSLLSPYQRQRPCCSGCPLSLTSITCCLVLCLLLHGYHPSRPPRRVTLLWGVPSAKLSKDIRTLPFPMDHMDGCWCFKGWLVIPCTKICKVLSEMHDKRGYFGQKRTLKICKERFWWPKMS